MLWKKKVGEVVVLQHKGNGCKITLLIGSLSGGGAERVTCNLANYLLKNGYNVDVLTLSNKNDSYRLADGVKRINLLDETERTNKIKNLSIKWKRLKKYVKENQDISCYVTLLPISVFMLMRLKKYIKCKIIISERNNPASYGMVDRFMMNYGAKRCDGLVVQTKEIDKWYSWVEKRIIIPNAINEDVFIPERKGIKKKIVAVGRLNKQKNYPMIIRSFGIFSEKHPDYRLEIFGQGGEEGYLKRLIEEYDLQEKVEIKGYVKDVSRQISDAACFVMASDYEGMPNALIEAMCIGIPCVVTDCDGGGARELINNMENGILIKKGAIEDMAHGMSLVIENEKLSKKISENAKLLKKKLDADRIYGEWLDFIEEVIR